MPELREPNTTMPETAHGKSTGYGVWACRCAPCRAYKRAENQRVVARYQAAYEAGAARRRSFDVEDGRA